MEWLISNHSMKLISTLNQKSQLLQDHSWATVLFWAETHKNVWFLKIYHPKNQCTYFILAGTTIQLLVSKICINVAVGLHWVRDYKGPDRSTVTTRISAQPETLQVNMLKFCGYHPETQSDIHTHPPPPSTLQFHVPCAAGNGVCCTICTGHRRAMHSPTSRTAVSHLSPCWCWSRGNWLRCAILDFLNLLQCAHYVSLFIVVVQCADVSVRLVLYFCADIFHFSFGWCSCTCHVWL